jgi:hypothetical protein
MPPTRDQPYLRHCASSFSQIPRHLWLGLAGPPGCLPRGRHHGMFVPRHCPVHGHASACRSVVHSLARSDKPEHFTNLRALGAACAPAPSKLMPMSLRSSPGQPGARSQGTARPLMLPQSLQLGVQWPAITPPDPRRLCPRLPPVLVHTPHHGSAAVGRGARPATPLVRSAALPRSPGPGWTTAR